MRAKNLNTMYRRRSVRPDARVYRQIRKLGGASPRFRSRGGGMGGLVLVVIGVIVVASVAAWLLRR